MREEERCDKSLTPVNTTKYRSYLVLKRAYYINLRRVSLHMSFHLFFVHKPSINLSYLQKLRINQASFTSLAPAQA
jgi:hypothetical protein